MISNSDEIVQPVQQDFQALLAYVTGANVRTQTTYTVELTLFRRLLALGAAWLRLFFVTRAAPKAGRARRGPGRYAAKVS